MLQNNMVCVRGEAMDFKRKFFFNLSYAIVAQLVAMIISVGVNLILPKFLDVKNYSYWQLFIFYSQYIPFLHLGLNDGVYLRYGGITYGKMNKNIIKSQMLLGYLFQFLFCIILCICSSLLVTEHNRILTIILACTFFLFYTVQNYMGYIFQAANETSWYSKSMILNRLSFLVIMFICLLGKMYICWPYIYGYIIAQIVSLVYSGVKGREILYAQLCGFKNTIREMLQSINVGSKLMFANIASMLVLGSGRFIVDQKWGIESFGRFSFALSLCNFFLLFIGQVSMVLFPALRQTDHKTMRQLYSSIRDGLSIFLSGILLFYLPIKFVLGIWLPQYQESLEYMAILLPLCTFDGQMQMLSNTYLQVLRKERVLLYINILSFVLSISLALVGAYILNNIYAIIISMVVAIAFRSIISEMYLSKLLRFSFVKGLLWECSLSILFVSLSWFANSAVGFMIYLVAYIFYLGTNRQKIVGLFVKYRNSLISNL